MPTRGLVLTFIGCFTFGSCDDSPPPTPTPPSSQTEERLTGSERLGWDQQAANGGELASYRYAIYVDGMRSELADVVCGDTEGPQGFACSARLPAIVAGSHTLELAAFVVDGGVLESGRSAGLLVLVAPAPMLSRAKGWSVGQLITTSDNIRLRLELMTNDLDDPTDLGFTPDGRVFVAERSGRIGIVRDGQLETTAPLPLDLRQAQVDGALHRTLEEPAAAGEGGLLALAVDPQFRQTRFVYVIYAARSPDESLIFRLARFREAHGTFAERAILLDNIPAATDRPAASLRFGADQKLYGVFDDGGNARSGGDLSSYNGKILRLKPDGTTPSDQPGGSPFYAYAVRSPRGLDWQPTTGALWIADAVTGRSAHLDVVANNDARDMRGVVAAKYALPESMGVASMAFYQSPAIPAFGGDLLIAAAEGRYILRLQFGRGGTSRIVASERLLENRVGALRALGINRRGEIYFCAGNALGRLLPQF